MRSFKFCKEGMIVRRQKCETNDSDGVAENEIRGKGGRSGPFYNEVCIATDATTGPRRPG